MDPLIGTALAKAAGKVGDEAGKATGNLVARVLGPAADELGEAIRRWSAFRLRNVGKIVEIADTKSDASGEGQVPPRVAHRILDEGSLCDDPLMAEYLGGVLAGSRSESGRDDRAVAWAGLVSSMSALEVRAHFMLYEAWGRALHGHNELDLWGLTDRRRALLQVDEIEFMHTLARESGVDPGPAIGHALVGLRRHGLLGDGTAWGPRDHVIYEDLAYDNVVVGDLTHAGIELFGWALGQPGVTATEFVSLDLSRLDASLPRVTRLVVPGLAPPDAS